MESYNIFWFNSIDILDIVFDSSKVRLRSNLIYDDDETMIIIAHKVSQDFWFDVFRAILMLAMWSSNKDMNFEMLSASIDTMTWCLEDFFVVILILSFDLPELLVVLDISFIFFKISLILGNKACMYNQLSLLLDLLVGFLHLFLKNFDFFKTFILSLRGIRSRTLNISAFLPVFNILAFLKEWLPWFFRLNFEVTFWQNVLLWLSAFKES